MSRGLPQESFLGHKLSLIYINYLNASIADDTNLLYINDYSIKKLNKALNCDVKNLTNWLNKNKISLNVITYPSATLN